MRQRCICEKRVMYEDSSMKVTSNYQYNTNSVNSRSLQHAQTNSDKNVLDIYGKCVSFFISQAGREKAKDIGDSNLIKARDNAVVIDDPIRAAHEKYGTLIRVDADGTEVWDINPENVAKFDRAVEDGLKKLGGRDNYNFWIRLSQKDPTFMGLTYSAKEIRNRLHSAGIQKGFFTVTVGDHTATHFLSEGRNAAAVYSKAYYDDQFYNYVKSGSICRNYEPGDVFRIDGEEYTVTDDKKLDIPYGAGIWNIEWPNANSIRNGNSEQEG